MAEGIVFETGTAVRLELLDGPEVPPIQASIRYQSDTELEIELPAGIEIPEDMPVHGEVPDDDGVYAFDTICLGAGESVGRTVRLAIPGAFERTQRRATARVPDQLNVSIIIKEDGRIASMSSTTFDVSVGGLSLLAPRAVSGTLTLVLSVPNPDGGMARRLRLDGDVRRCVPVGEGTYRVAVAFLDLGDEEESVLSQHLFRRMREIRRSKAGR